ncbi:MAG: BrnT family toxin [Nitrosospira sp.]|nr:BrnT family toxin [Nitrosospira sp.]
MEFEWDLDKAETNLRKHNVSFEDAARVFIDPSRIETFDGREVYGEDRWKTVGLVEPVLLTVVYTVRGQDDEIIRLISARKADADERAQYCKIQT